jgi:hypothetical protein
MQQFAECLGLCNSACAFLRAFRFEHNLHKDVAVIQEHCIEVLVCELDRDFRVMAVLTI